MKKKFKTISIAFLAIIIMSGFNSCKRIDAGHVGIKVNLYGSNKGVDNITEVTGMCFYNPISHSVYEFPTFMQHKVWTKDKSEDNPGNEEMTITPKGGSNCTIDVGLNYSVDATKVPTIFQKYRKDLPTITEQFIRNTVRQVLNDLAATYTIDSLLDHRSDYEHEAEKQLKARLADDGFLVTQLVITAFRAPDALQTSIDAKNKAKQDALNMELQKQKVVAENAQIVLKADAEAYKIRTVNQAMKDAPYYIQLKTLEKWDGKYPEYLVINGSSNSSQLILPSPSVK